jgi:hypothetical protein
MLSGNDLFGMHLEGTVDVLLGPDIADRYCDSWCGLYLAIYLVFLLIALGPDLCANQIYQEVYSADRTLKAVVFQRDCGATTGFSTQVSVLPAGETLTNDIAGNLYIANGRPADSQLMLQWSSQRSMLIQGHVTDAIKQETMIEDVVVSYIQAVDH